MGEPVTNKGIELVSGSGSRSRIDDRAKRGMIDAIRRGPYRATDLSLAEVEEILLAVQHAASLMLSSAVRDVLITDQEIEKSANVYHRNDLIADKVTAYEWIFKQTWLGMPPRLSIEEVAPVMHLHPDFVRRRVRRHRSFTGPTRYQMHPGYRISELWDDLCPVCEGKKVVPDPRGEGRTTCPSCRGLGTKREDRVRSKPDAESPNLALPSTSLISCPEVPPERAAAAQEIMEGLLEDARTKPLVLPDEIDRACRLGLDILADAPSGIRYDDK